MDLNYEQICCGLLEDKYAAYNDWTAKGDDIQKLSVLQALPQLLQTEPQATFGRIIPKILQELPKSSCEFHVMTSKVFRILIERNLAGGNLLNAILQGIDSKDLIISNTWMETLLAVVDHLSETQIKNEIIPLANSKSLLVQSIGARVASCRILGKLALHSSLKPVDVKRDLLPLVQSLSQDCHPDVRSAMCVQLPFVAQGLGGDLVKSGLLTSLVELASDDNMYVRSSAVGVIVHMFPHLTLDDKTNTILPLVKLMCEKSLKSIDITSITVARDLGKLIEGLQASLKQQDSVWFLHCYKVLSRRGLSSEIGEFRSNDPSLDVVCRQHCASNLPVMASFTFAVMPTQAENLYGIFQELAADPCYIVRGTVAGCIQEITKIFGPHGKMIKPDLVRLLSDDSEDVLLKLAPQLGNTLELLCVHGTLSRQTSNQAALEIGRAMLKCQYELSNGCNWRLLTHFIHQLEHLPNCMPSDFIHQHFTPVVLTSAVQGRARPVRTQAVRTLLVFLKFNKKELQRKWLRENMIVQLCQAECSYTRHIYVRLCLNALDIFSERYFKEHFYESLLDLADDPVANVRLCVASMFVALKQMVGSPEDCVLNERLEKVFAKYATQEMDRDVVAIFQTKMREIRGPRRATEIQEHAVEQRRRVEEEERLASTKSWKGPLPVIVAAPTRRITGKNEKGPVAGSNSNNLDSTQRSASVPRRNPNATDHQNGDMSFLEQHFYTDAGIGLPLKRSDSRSNKTNIPPGLRSKFSNVIATDDDKTNLKKISALETKRSQRLSLTCLEKNRSSSDRKLWNRRSLNVPVGDTSKIPIARDFPSGVGRLRKNNGAWHDENDDPERKETAEARTVNGDCAEIDGGMPRASRLKSPSQLPVFKRRTHSEARK